VGKTNGVNAIAVYERADGSIYYNDGGRVKVGFYQKWTTCSGELMANTKASSSGKTGDGTEEGSNGGEGGKSSPGSQKSKGKKMKKVR
jgi:hypothetical protein